MKKYTFLLVLLLALGGTLWNGCSESEDEEMLSSPARLKVYMHDQPANFQQVNVDVQSLEVKGEGEDETILIGQYAGVYNLLDLQDGTLALLADTLVSFGHISQLRIILGENNTVMVDSVLYPLQTPSAQQSGLKVNIHQDLGGLDSLVITLDFDAYESVVQTGNGGYILQPVIHVD